VSSNIISYTKFLSLILYSGEPTKLFLTKFATVLYRSLFHARGDSTSLSLLNVEYIRRVDAIGLLH